MVALLGLVSALFYGASDFFGGLAARRIPALETSLVAFATAAVLVLGVSVVFPPECSTSALVLWLLSGVSGAIGQWAFYACLAIGPMSILSPAVATVYALVPAAVGILGGERFSAVGYVALVAVVVAAVLLAVPRTRTGERVSPRALLLGLVAGLGFAGYIIAIHGTPPESGVAPVLADYAASLVIYLGILVVTALRRRAATRAAGVDPSTFSLLQLERRGVWFAVIAGVQIGIANVLLVSALHIGDLALVGVLNSLYPLGTVVLALALLKERISVPQAIGVGLALAAAAALAVP